MEPRHGRGNFCGTRGFFFPKMPIGSASFSQSPSGFAFGFGLMVIEDWGPNFCDCLRASPKYHSFRSHSSIIRWWMDKILHQLVGDSQYKASFVHGAGVRPFTVSYFRLLKSISYFPLLALKGIYHYWEYSLFFGFFLGA